MMIFVTDGLLRKTLSVTRSLGKEGHEVIVGERTALQMSAFSKYCKKHVVYPSPKEQPVQYHEWLLRFLQSEAIDVYIPMDDSSMELAIAYHEELATRCSVLLPPKTSYQLASDKYLATKLAQEAGIDVPKTFCPESIEEVNIVAPSVTYPVVIKPRISSGSRGITIVHTHEELVEAYYSVSKRYDRPMIQEYIPPGERYDVCLIYNKQHEQKASFIQKELRHFPMPMGPSTLLESAHDSGLERIALQLMDKLPWVGVVEVEFMKDPRDGLMKFMEINTRFWNSLELSVQSGINYPAYLLQIIQTDEIEKIASYESGKKCGSLLPVDTLHFLSVRKRGKMRDPFFNRKKNGIQDDIISRQDWMPTVGFFISLLRLVFMKEMWKLMFRR